jgi:hypothetical protein
MQNGLTAFNRLRRPPLLIRAARIGMAGYDRPTHLARHLGDGPLPRAGDALAPLIEIEAALEADRKGRAAHYQAARHMDVLIAMIGEVRCMQVAQAVEA